MNKLLIGVILSLLLSLSSAYAEVSPETVVDIFQRLEALEKKARELNGENEVLKHQLNQLKKAQKQGFLSVDERLEALLNKVESEPKSKPKKDEGESKTKDSKDDTKVKIIDSSGEKKTSENENNASTTTSIATSKKIEQQVKTKPATTVTPNKKIRAPNSYERETYKAAFTLMKKSPTAATKAFQEYIRMQPESPLAANAQYWIGEIKYSHNNYKGAVQEFIKVLQKYKYSDKAPDAAIKLGYSFYALKNWKYARRTFDDVIKYFPDNKNAVNLAQRRLAKMTAEGH